MEVAAGRMHSAYGFYCVWKWIELSRNIQIGELLAKGNVEVMGRYPILFSVLLRSSFYNFIIDLSIFFDKNDDSLSINKIISELNIDNNIKEEIEKIIKSQKINIEKLKNIRNKDVAHFDMHFDRANIPNIVYKEFEELFFAVQKIFNILSTAFDGSKWVWNHFEEDTLRQGQIFFEDLRMAEKMRLDGIEDTLLKPFSKWTDIKRGLEKKEKNVLFHEREIWWCSLGLNIGFEQDGKNDQFERPVLILKKYSKDFLIVAPLTSKEKSGEYYFSFIVRDKKHTVILSQQRAISSKRLNRLMYKVGDSIFDKIITNIKELYPIKDDSRLLGGISGA
ncbi:MAG: type II toxin-antitoxin system PemK/MazF family toxin [Candidatus Taylorbacteria bacterium]|nr:type II toxin-antitoxin system PemK/MazF family toxin [Candidatus Taylorbacteria bacterium]